MIFLVFFLTSFLLFPGFRLVLCSVSSSSLLILYICYIVFNPCCYCYVSDCLSITRFSFLPVGGVARFRALVSGSVVRDFM